MKTLHPLQWRTRLPRPDLKPPPALAAGLIQLAAVLATCAQALWLGRLVEVSLTPLQWALVEGAIACALATYFGCAKWWRVMHLVFAPALVLGLALRLPPQFSLVLLLLLVGVYWTSYRSQVPLYLSGESAWREVARLLPTTPGTRVIDLGSGLGGLVGYLSVNCPEAKIDGIEAAPLPLLASRIRRWLAGWRCRLSWGDLWQVNLAQYDVAHAYLSPVPMPRLWNKVCSEMRPGSLLISHSFPVPGVTPALVRNLPRGRRIYVYRIGC
jgi:hypothetical protein